MEDENHCSAAQEEELKETKAGEEEEERGYKSIRADFSLERGLQSVWNKRKNTMKQVFEWMQRMDGRLEELNKQEVEFIQMKVREEKARWEKRHREEVEKLKEELSAARGMVRELQKELELEKDKRRRGIPLIEGEDEEWNPDEERAKERVGDGRDESWLKK